MLPEPLALRIRAFQESRVFLTAIELDLFNAVGAGATAAQVAAALATDPRATEMLMHALVSLGMLEKQGDVFRNSPDATRYFVSTSPDDHRMALMHIVNLWTRWTSLTDCVRTGAAAPDRSDLARQSADSTEAFIAAMHSNASERAPAVVEAVGIRGVRRLLDIGGGSGAYSIAFARANPELRAEILDLASVVPIAQRYIGRAGVTDRVTPRVGDLRAGNFGAGYDLVIIFAICHMLDEQENADLIAHSFAALAPGGRLVIQDFLLNPDRTGPPMSALFALNMLVGTARGNTYTEEQYRSWMRAAGFDEIRRHDLHGPASLILGTRPKN